MALFAWIAAALILWCGYAVEAKSPAYPVVAERPFPARPARQILAGGSSDPAALHTMLRLRGGADQKAVEALPEHVVISSLGERGGDIKTTRFDGIALFTFDEDSGTWVERFSGGTAEVVEREGGSTLIRAFSGPPDARLLLQQAITSKMEFHGLATTDRCPPIASLTTFRPREIRFLPVSLPPHN